jgi:NAD-dependent oxidoreductase involved in siderophore biosynthesis
MGIGSIASAVAGVLLAGMVPAGIIKTRHLAHMVGVESLRAPLTIPTSVSPPHAVAQFAAAL